MEAVSTNNKAWYRSWFNSPYYHQLYFQRDEKEAAAFIDRLTMTPKTIESMALGLEQIVSLEDPIGKISALQKQASGIGCSKTAFCHSGSGSRSKTSHFSS